MDIKDIKIRRIRITLKDREIDCLYHILLSTPNSLLQGYIKDNSIKDDILYFKRELLEQLKVIKDL